MSGFYRLRSGAPAPGPSYKKRRTFAPSTTTQQLAQLKRKVNALKPETKCAAVTGSLPNVVPAVGAIAYISSIAQGVTKQTRLGDQIRLNRLQFRIQAVDTQSNAGGNFCFRIMLVRDKAATGAAPSISGAVTSVLTNGTSLAMQNPAILDRFTVIKDWSYNGNQLSAGDIIGTYWCDMKMNHLLDYVDATASTTGAGSNSLYVIVVHDATASTSDFNFSANLYFTDV